MASTTKCSGRNIASVATRHQEFFDTVIANQPIKRVGQPEEVADAVMFLVESGYVTGTVVDVEGGALLP